MPRKRIGAWLPPNLYRADGRFRYKGAKWESWYMPEAEAIAEATRRNALREGASPNTVYKVIERYRERLAREGHADTTLREKNRILKIYQDKIGDVDWKFVDRQVLRAKWASLKGPHAWGKHRLVWVGLYRFAIAEGGYCDFNEAEAALPPTAAELERITARHTVEGYEAIYEAAPEWLQIAMELAVASLQDLSTLVRAKRTDYADGIWKVRRSKTGAAIAITVPAASRLGKALQRAQTFPVFGSYLIRREPARRKRARSREEFTQVRGTFLSQEFARIRKASKAYEGMPDEQLPDWKALRSFGVHLYEEAGYSTEYIQALCAHKSPKMTEHYADGYGERYASAEAGL